MRCGTPPLSLGFSPPAFRVTLGFPGVMAPPAGVWAGVGLPSPTIF